MNELSKKIKQGCLLTCGNMTNFNTMTIGWGMIGTIWGKEVFMCFVRPTRYTFEFMEKYNYFTISFYNENYKEALSYLGTHSGKFCNKVSEVGFNPLSCGESVTFIESYESLLCKKIYFQDMNLNEFQPTIKNTYYNVGGIHRFYIGEIILKTNSN